MRRLLSLRRVGHAGTLDPDASGVLVLCLGGATRVSRYLMEGEKEYLATLRLGFRTNTADRSGEPVGESRPVRFEADAVREACARWVGDVDQIPPMVSAVKHGGVRLYKLARAGVAVDRVPRRVRIEEIEVLAISLPFVRLRIRCGTGTYVRVLAEDIGDALGCGAHLFALRRTRVGVVSIGGALRWDQLERSHSEGRLTGQILSTDAALGFLPALDLSEEDTRRIRTGRWILGKNLHPEPRGLRWMRLRDPDGNLVAIGEVSGERDERGVTIRPARVLSALG